MTTHRFDLVAAALGVIAVALGLLVATDSIDRVDADAGWWFAVAALVLGIAMVPWSRRRDDEHVDAAVPEPSAPED